MSLNQLCLRMQNRHFVWPKYSLFKIEAIHFVMSQQPNIIMNMNHWTQHEESSNLNTQQHEYAHMNVWRFQ